MILNLNISMVSKVVGGIIAFFLMGYASFKLTGKAGAELEKIKGYENFMSLILLYVLMLLLALYPIPYLRDLAEASKTGIQGNILPLILALTVIPLTIHFIITPLTIGMFTVYIKKLSRTSEDNKGIVIFVSLLLFLGIVFISLKISPIIWNFFGIY